MFELNGQKFTLEQIQDAANKSNLSLEEYLTKSGITRVLESSQDFQNPTIPGAVVGESQAPDTESKLENTSSEPATSAKVNIPNIPFPVTVTTDERSTDGMSYDEIFLQEVNNVIPAFAQTWQNLKANTVDWYIKKGFVPSGNVATNTALTSISKIPAVQDFKENVTNFLFKNLIYKKDDAVEFKDATEKFMIDTYNNSARIGDQIKSSGSLVKGITELNPKEFAGGAAQTIRSLVTTMVPAIATRGASIYPQISGQMYVDYNTEKAKALYGDDPEAINRLIKENKTEVTTPMLLAGVAAASEYAGLKGVTQAIKKNIGEKIIGKFAQTLYASGGEGATELFQSGVESYSKGLAGGKNAIEAGEDFFNTVFSEEGMESFLQGAFGGGVMTAGGSVISNAYITAREQGSNMGIVPNNMSKLANLKRERATTSDETVREGLDLEIEKVENETKTVVQEGNDIVDNASEQEVAVLADAQVALKLYETQVSTLVSKLEAGEINQQEHDFALTGYVNQYVKSQEAARDTISEISNKNEQASKNNEELLGIIKNTESTEQQVSTAKNKLVENNQGLINNIVNRNFNPTLDTTLTKEDFASEINIEFSKLINSYKPETGTPFGAYVQQNLPKRLPAIFDKLVETKTNEETGKKEIIAKQDITDTQIEGETTTQGEVKLETEKTKSVKNKLFTAKLGFDKKFVPGQTDKTFADVFSEAVAKTFGTSLPEVTDKNFVKEFQKKNRAELTPIIQDLLKKDKDTGVDNFKIFLEQNFDEVINQLPQNVINKKYPMLREAVLNEEGKQQREGTKEGKGVFKRVEQEKSDFIDYFTATEDKATGKKIGSSTRSDRKQSLLRTLVDELSADAALEVTKDQTIMDKFKEVQEVEGKAVPDNFLDVIIEKLDRGIEYINKVQKNSNLYFSTGIDKIVLQASKMFLQTLKAGIKAGKEFVSALNEALEKLSSTLSKKYDETTVEAIKTRVETEILENVDSESAPKFYNIAEIINNVAAGERGRAYEQKILDVLNSFKIKELTVAKKTANKVGSNNPDIPIKFKNQESNIEVKLSSEEQMGSLTANYDMDNQNFKVTKEVDPAINDIINELLKEKQKDTDNYFKRAVELGGVKSKTGVKLDKKQRKKLQDEGLQAKLSGRISTNSTQLLADLENKEGTYYIQMGEKGLFYLGKDILKLGVPKLEGNISLEYRIASGGKADKQGRKNHSLRMFLRLKDFKTKSTESLDDINSVRRLFSNEPSSANSELNEMLERTKGIASTERVSVAKAKTLGAKKERAKLFVPNTAEDLLGLLYRFAGKGKQGDADLKWIKQTFTRPLTRANLEFEALQVRSNEFLKEAKDIMSSAGVDLTKEAIDGYTVEQAIRIHLWTKRGFKVPGMDQNIDKEPGPEQAKVNQWVRQNFDSLEFTDAIEQAYIKNESKYPEPDEDWISGTITTDLLEFTNTQTRAEIFQPFFDNINAALGKFDKFNGKLSGPTINKIRSIYGNSFVEALESSFYRIGTGKNRTYQLDKQGGVMLDWLNNAIGNIMFINTRSALLQTISAANFVNWSDNNPLNAAKAWANQPKFWSYFNKIFFSDYLESRRSGLRTDVNEQEIATAAANSKNPTRAVIATILKKGFMPTQYADSFAIAFGGSSFLSNREAKYKKDGMSEQDAFDKAFEDMREIAEDTQQSGRPEKISQEQSGFAGRLILAFQNTPMQYNRQIKKAGLDLINNRGDWKTNISKIIYYGGIQNALFYSLQQALFTIMFDEPEDEKEEKREKERYYRVANGMADSILRGSGVFGAMLGTTKNVILKIAEREGFDEKAIEEIFNLSPPIGTKTRKLFDIKDKFTYKQELAKMREMGVDTENPAVLAAGDALSFGLNLPADRALRKINNLRAAYDKENETWQRIALSLGWSKWDVGIPFESASKSNIKTKKLTTKKLK